MHQNYSQIWSPQWWMSWRCTPTENCSLWRPRLLIFEELIATSKTGKKAWHPYHRMKETRYTSTAHMVQVSVGWKMYNSCLFPSRLVYLSYYRRSPAPSISYLGSLRMATQQWKRPLPSRSPDVPSVSSCWPGARYNLSGVFWSKPNGRTKKAMAILEVWVDLHSDNVLTGCYYRGRTG